MDKELTHGPMEIHIMESSRMMKEMVKEHLLGITILGFMMECGKMANSMVKEFIKKKDAQIKKVNGKKVKS